MTARSTNPEPKKDAKTGTWTFRFDGVHPNPDGSRRQIRRRGFLTLKEAKSALDQLQREDANLSPSAVAGMTVAAVMGSFVRSKQLAGKAPGTIAQYEWASRIVGERWAGWEASRLTGDHLEQAYAEMLKGGRRQWHRGKGTEATGRPMSRRSVEVVHKTTKAAFKLAVDRGQLVRNPAALISVGADRERSERPHWTPEQVGHFLEFMADRSDLPTALVDVMADTGARVGEVAGLRWPSVDFDAGTLTITGQIVSDPTYSKVLHDRPTKRPRSKSTLGLHPATVIALGRRKKQQKEDRLRIGSGWPKSGVAADLVFTWADGSPLHPKTLSRIIGRLSVEAGPPRLTAHGLRHSFATAALAARVPVEVVAARLGNTPRMVQEVYQHVIPADDAGAALIVGDLYRGRRHA